MKLKKLIEEKTAWQIYSSKNKDSNALIKVDKEGEYIYYAGVDWKDFNYKKGLEKLKNLNKFYYERALEVWPKNIEMSQIRSKEIRKSAKKLPKKELKL